MLEVGWSPNFSRRDIRLASLISICSEPMSFPTPAQNRGLREIKGDLRDAEIVAASLADCSYVIHLACISNDPSFELDPALGSP